MAAKRPDFAWLLRGFDLGVALVRPTFELVLLEELDELLSEQPAARPCWVGFADHGHRRVAVAVQARVALRFAQGPEPGHARNVAPVPDGPARFSRMAEPRARVFEYQVAYDGTSVATAKEATLDVPEAWSPEHLVLAALLDCSLTSLRGRAGGCSESSSSGSSRSTNSKAGRTSFPRSKQRK